MLFDHLYKLLANLMDERYSLHKLSIHWFLSAIVMLFLLAMVLYVPCKLNWIDYSLSCVILRIVVALYFVSKVFDDILDDVIEQDMRNAFRKFYYTGIVLVPLWLVLVLFVPNDDNLRLIVYFVMFLFLGITISHVNSKGFI